MTGLSAKTDFYQLSEKRLSIEPRNHQFFFPRFISAKKLTISGIGVRGQSYPTIGLESYDDGERDYIFVEIKIYEENSMISNLKKKDY
jgi:hypothetical protein